jgi:hypothetical protein
MTFLFRRCARGNAGFLLAPLLYMLAIAGIGAAVMFSGYSQILRSNAQMTAINAVRSQLQSAGTTLAASSVLDSATSTIVQPPAVYPFGSVAGGDIARLPASYTNASSTGTPHDVGVVDTATGVRQLDPWGKFYVYCRWENPVSSPALPSIMVISAGPDGNLDTKCGDTIAQGDDKIIASTVAETINRANVWQVNSSSQIKYGLAANPVEVNANGALQAAMLTLGSAPAASTSGQLSAISANISGALTAGSTTFSGATITGNATIGGTLGVTGAATFSGTLAAGATSLSSLTLTTALAVAQGGTGATTAAGARTDLGSTAVGDAVFTAASAGAARTTLGSTTVGDALFTAASAAAARTTLGSTTVGDALFIAADAPTARSTLGLGTMATQNANAVAITGGTITGVTFTGNITGNASGSAGSVAASGVTGCCVAISAGGTNAGDAATARSNLGTNNASNLTTGTVTATLLPTSGVVAGTYTQVTVDVYGRVTIGANVNSSQWTNSGSNIYFNTGDVSIGTTVANTELNVYNASSATLTDFTQGLSKGAINVLTNYTANNYTPGVFWSATDDNATKPKAGIWLKEAAAGTTMYLGTSNAYATGITNQALSIDQNGVVTASGGFVGNITGNVTGNVSGSISLSDGTAASPGLYFTNNTNTGIYRPGNDVLGIAAGGNDVARFVGNTSGVNYLSLSAATTGNAVVIAGAGTDTNVDMNINAKGTGTVKVTSQAAGAVAATIKAAASQTGDLQEWQNSSGTVLSEVNSSGYLGVNQTTASAPLDVTGNWGGSYGAVRFTGDKPTIRLDSTQGATSNQKWIMHVGAFTSGGIEFYTGTNGSSWTNIFAMTPAGRVGVGTTGPNHTLDVNGNIGIAASGYLNFGSTDGSSGYGVRDNSGTIEIKNSGGSWGAPLTASSTITANNFAAGSVGSPGLYVVGNATTGLYQATSNTLSVTAGGVEVERWNTVASGVNYLNMTAAATGNGPIIAVAGSDTNIDLNINAKGTGSIRHTAQAAGAVVEIIKGAASQTGDLQEWLKSDNTVLAKVDASGYIAEQASGYINFGSTTGSGGYGVRDNGGNIEIKNSGGSWAAPLVNGSTITSGTWNGSTITVPYGGTGDTTLTLNGVLYGNGASAVQVTAQGAANSVLTANAGAPSFSASPTIGTSVTTPLLIGGTAASSTLTLESTSGAGTSDAIIFKTASQAEAMRINTSGNLGIGTTTPAGKFQILGANNTDLVTWLTTQGTGNSYLELGISGSSVELEGLSNGDFYINHYGVVAGAFKSIRSGAVANTLVLNAGNVGIGTASPAAKLDVVTGGGGHMYTSDYGCGAYGGVGGSATLTGCTNYALLTNGTDTFINRPSGSNIQFREANANQMTILTGGNVGIGLTAPVVKFQAGDATNTAGIESRSDGVNIDGVGAANYFPAQN